MRARERVERTRRALALAVIARAMLLGVAAGSAAAALAHVAARRAGAAAPTLTWLAAMVVGAAVAAVVMRRRLRLTVPRVALWIEERVPRLRFALVTAVDPAGAGSAVLEREVDGVSWSVETRAAIVKGLRGPALAALVAVAALVLARRVSFAAPDSADRLASGVSMASHNAPAPFARLVATVRAPSYAGGRVARIESPASVTALVGSAVTLEAPGTGDGITADVAGQDMRVTRAGDRWRVQFSVGARPALVRLRHASGERLVAIEPTVDSVPNVRLALPARDTVVRAAAGALGLRADAHDDIGLASAGFEYIVSSGEGESFRFRSGTFGARRLDGGTDAVLSAALSLDGLALKPGDMVHIRAVARDANTVTGPGVGASETRVLRVARAGEYDSIAVEGAPPPEADKSLISQRMLIILTEALDKRRPSLARDALLTESRTIARDETRLRRRVGDIIFARLGDNPSGEEGKGPDDEPASDSAFARTDTAVRGPVRRSAGRAGRSARALAAADSADSARAALLRAASAATGRGSEILDFEGDETPVVAINRPLLEAYNAMWEASRELEQGETGRALPPMRRALAAIQRARQAERIYLRGKAPAVVVDLARVRLTGKDTGAASTRQPRQPVDPIAARRAERLVAAIALAAQSPSAAIDSLVLLRVESLDSAPRLAEALATAVDAMRNGRDATGLLVRARRIAAGDVGGVGTLGAWSGVW